MGSSTNLHADSRLLSMTCLAMSSIPAERLPSRLGRAGADRLRRWWHRRAALALLGAAFLTACGGGEPQAATPADTRDSAPAARGAPIEPVLPRQLEGLTPRAGAIVARVAVRRDTTTFGTGPAVVTLTTGDTLVVSDSAIRVWALGGALVAISGLDGAGGFENEGQSLTVIDVAAGSRRRVLSDYFVIVRVERIASPGRTPLLVHMRDGGRGSLHVSVVDARRGAVFRTLNALGRVDGDRAIVSGFGDGERPVEFGDRRTPLRVDTIPAAAIDTLPLLVVPRGPR